MVATDPARGKRPASAAALRSLIKSLRRDRVSLRSVALVSDVELAEGDAVRVQLEHREGQVVTMILPYTKRHFGHGIHYGDLSAESGEPLVWTD